MTRPASYQPPKRCETCVYVSPDWSAILGGYSTSRTCLFGHKNIDPLRLDPKTADENRVHPAGVCDEWEARKP